MLTARRVPLRARSKSTKYKLRVNRVDDAKATVALFARVRRVCCVWAHVGGSGLNAAGAPAGLH